MFGSAILIGTSVASSVGSAWTLASLTIGIIAGVATVAAFAMPLAKMMMSESNDYTPWFAKMLGKRELRA